MCRGCDSLPPGDEPDDQPGTGLARRAFLRGAAGTAVGLLAFGRVTPTWGAPVKVAGDIEIHPRSDWGADLVPGALQPETDVRFLLVHHTEGQSEYSEDGAIDQMRGVFNYHTGPDKRWSDVCYNFFVDRFGRIFEARAGSLAGPVMADATGGSQGFAQLICLLGNFMKYQPSVEMMESTARLLAFLADRYSISTDVGATAQFTSRGSNKWSAGTPVVARTISGHRDMSQTDCPGDNVYVLLDTLIPDRVRQLRSGIITPPTTTTTTTTTTTQAPVVGGSSATDPPVNNPPPVGATLPNGAGGTFAPPLERQAPATLPELVVGDFGPTTVPYDGSFGSESALPQFGTPQTIPPGGTRTAAQGNLPAAVPADTTGSTRAASTLASAAGTEQTGEPRGRVSGRPAAIAAGGALLAAIGSMGAIAMSRRLEHLEYRPPARPDRRDDPDADLWGHADRP